MPYNQSGGGFGKAVFGIVIFVALLGALSAIGFAHGNTAQDRAVADQIQANTAWETQTRQMGLPYMQAQLEQEAAIAAAQSSAELARLEAEKQAYLHRMTEEERMLVESNNLLLVSKGRWQTVGMGLTALSGIAIILVLVTTMSRIVLGLVDRHMLKQSSIPSINLNSLWDKPEYRKQMIALAREQEHLSRQGNQQPSNSRIHHRNGRSRNQISV